MGLDGIPVRVAAGAPMVGARDQAVGFALSTVAVAVGVGSAGGGVARGAAGAQATRPRANDTTRVKENWA